MSRRTLTGLLGAVLALAVWWVTSAGSTNPFYPPLPRVLESLVEYWLGGAGTEHLLDSVRNLGVGLGVAVALGIGLGMLIGQVRVLDQAVSPTFEFVRAIPATALLPFAMVLFGLGTSMKIFIIALGCFFPILLNVIDGCRQLPPTLLDTTRSFGITGWFRQLNVVAPAIYPRAAAGIRIAIPLALILVVTSEMTGSNTGIGFVLYTAQSSFNLVAVWAAILLLGILGLLLNLLFGVFERLTDRRYHRA
ncbi:ABC transporter permease [Georgenia sp. H159]|uniref:ABC transporter permease n=1 Tax=Georgenia sp. H159 TaxID=3076115 RepID=UPI002D789F89|nr:ABC transporter permease subunit [Georgenia sp. H159]